MPKQISESTVEAIRERAEKSGASSEVAHQVARDSAERLNLQKQGATAKESERIVRERREGK